MQPREKMRHEEAAEVRKNPKPPGKAGPDFILI